MTSSRIIHTPLNEEPRDYDAGLSVSVGISDQRLRREVVDILRSASITRLVSRTLPDTRSRQRSEPEATVIDEDVMHRERGDLRFAVLVLREGDSESIVEATSSGCRSLVLRSNVRRYLLRAVNSVDIGAAWVDPMLSGELLDIASRGRVSYGSLTSSFRGLTTRESEILRHLARGKSNSQLAGILGISERTVKYHLTNVMRKLGVDSRSQVIAKYLSCFAG